MKTPLPLFLALVLCLCSGCFDIDEEYWFHKDHSGRYEMTIQLASMGPLLSMMQKMGSGTDSLPSIPKDTVILLSTLPDSLKRQMPYPALADRTSLTLNDRSGFKMIIALNFKDVAEIPLVWQNLSAIDTLVKGSEINGVSKLKSVANNIESSLAWKGQTLHLQAKAAPPVVEDFVPMGVGDLDNPMFKMMFGNSKYRLKFHFDSKVKSAKGKEMEREGMDAWATYALTDVMKDPAILSCSIKVRR